METNKIEKISVMLDDGAKMPTRAHETDAGYDLYAPENMHTKYLWKEDSVTIDTGCHILIPRGYCGVIVSKSGLNVNHDITSHGLVDAFYTGSIKVKLYNHGHEKYHIKPGDKISQIVILPIETPELEKVDVLPFTDRGEDGFGSSGR